MAIEAGISSAFFSSLSPPRMKSWVIRFSARRAMGLGPAGFRALLHFSRRPARPVGLQPDSLSAVSGQSTELNQTRNKDGNRGVIRKGGSRFLGRRYSAAAFSSSSVTSPESIFSASKPAWPRIRCSMEAAISGWSRRKALAFSRPWPMR